MRKFFVYGFILISIMSARGFAFADNAAWKQPKYSADGSKTFWFLQISDTHVSTFLAADYAARLKWVLSEGVSVVNPRFVINTGDLTDSTNGFVYGTGPHEDEYIEYKGYLDAAGMRSDFFFDVPGNHDAYGNAALPYYYKWAMSGSAFNTTQPHWALDFTYGRFHFLGAATPNDDGAQWPTDHAIVTPAERDELLANINKAGDCAFSMAFGHHDYKNETGGTETAALFAGNNVFYYSHGHEHDIGVRMTSDGILRFRINSLGQKTDNNFVVFAVDNYAVSWGATDHKNPWPLAVITAPVNAVFGAGTDSQVDNPHAPVVPKSCANAPLRALVFDKTPPLSVSYKIDGGQFKPMHNTQANKMQYRAKFDATALSADIHVITVEVNSVAKRSFESRFLVVDAPCDLGAEDDGSPLEGGIVTTFPPDSPVDGDEETAEIEQAAEEEPPVEDEPEAEPELSDIETELAADEPTEATENLCANDALKCDGTKIMVCINGERWEKSVDCALANTTCEEPAHCIEAAADGDGESADYEMEYPVDIVKSKDDGCAGANYGWGGVLIIAIILLKNRRKSAL